MDFDVNNRKLKLPDGNLFYTEKKMKIFDL